MRTRIKICGITNLEDAQAAVEYGADALGFILVPDTPRYISTPVYQPIIWGLPPFVDAVAVVKQCEEQELFPDIQDFDVVQFYEGDCSTTVTGVVLCVRAFRVKDEHSLIEIAKGIEYTRPNAILLDTYHKEKLGGAGETFNWQIAVEAKRRFELPIILAGGLTPENVVEAVRTVRPYAVDVSSGVEASPGRKDHVKIKAFIEAVRQADTE